MVTSQFVKNQILQEARDGKRTLIMGILNVTPDSFSDGGRYNSHSGALSRIEQMLHNGADIIDIGGESTRPATFESGKPLSITEELDRVIPVIQAAVARFPGLVISIDTYKSAVARSAIAAGACIVNDISALRADPEMADCVAKSDSAVCLMHLPGLPTRVEPVSDSRDIVEEVRSHLNSRIEAAQSAGIEIGNIVVDPGIGFGKSVQQNLELLRRQRELLISGIPLMIGTSRKATIGAVLGGAPVDDRLEGTAATVALAIAAGASIVRVHDVAEMAKVARMTDAIVRGWAPVSPGSAGA